MPRLLQPRRITSHQTNPANELLVIKVLDLPGQGGASHEYCVDRNFKEKTELDAIGLAKRIHDRTPNFQSVLISFQNGPINEAGVNGVTQEILLAIVVDRLESFQNGPYRCESNQVALSHVHAALEALKSRTKEREARGVEGTHKL